MSISKPILYSYWRSSCSWRVRIALNFKGIAYEIRPVNIVKSGGEQHRSEYRDINPMAKVPALHIDNHTLIESIAIMHYLEETRPQRPLLPQDPYTRTKVRELCEMIASGIQPLQNVGLISHLGKDKHKEWAQMWIARGFQAVEKILTTSSGKFSVGNEITMADCCLVPQVYNARRYEVDLSSYSNILRIDEALNTETAFSETHPLKQPDRPPKATE